MLGVVMAREARVGIWHLGATCANGACIWRLSHRKHCGASLGAGCRHQVCIRRSWRKGCGDSRLTRELGQKCDLAGSAQLEILYENGKLDGCTVSAFPVFGGALGPNFAISQFKTRNNGLAWDRLPRRNAVYFHSGAYSLPKAS